MWNTKSESSVKKQIGLDGCEYPYYVANSIELITDINL